MNLARGMATATLLASMVFGPASAHCADGATAGRQDPPSPDDASAKDKLAKVATKVAGRHVSLGEKEASRGMHGWARDEYCKAVALDRDHEAARKRLGDRRREDGSGWEVDPGAKIVVVNEKKKNAEEVIRLRAEYDKSLNELGKDSGRDWYEAGVEAERAGLKADALKAFERAVDYNPAHEEAHKKLGHEKQPNGKWMSPEEKKFREELTAGIKTAPGGEPDKTPSPFAEKLGATIQRRGSDHFLIESTNIPQEELKVLVQHAEQAQAMFEKLTGLSKLLPQKYRVLILKDRAEHQAFVDAFLEEKDATQKKFVRECAGHNGFPQSECFIAVPDPGQARDYCIHYTIQWHMIAATGGTAKWFMEGMALWFTTRMTYSNHWCCVQLAGTGAGDGRKEFKDCHKWPEIIKGWLTERNDPVIDAVLKAPNWAELDAAETVKAWSLVDFMIAEHREKLAPLMKALKADEKDSGEAAVRTVFGWTLQEFDANWRTWARGAY